MRNPSSRRMKIRELESELSEDVSKVMAVGEKTDVPEANFCKDEEENRFISHELSLIKSTEGTKQVSCPLAEKSGTDVQESESGGNEDGGRVTDVDGSEIIFTEGITQEEHNTLLTGDESVFNAGLVLAEYCRRNLEPFMDWLDTVDDDELLEMGCSVESLSFLNVEEDSCDSGVSLSVCKLEGKSSEADVEPCEDRAEPDGYRFVDVSKKIVNRRSEADARDPEESFEMNGDDAMSKECLVPMNRPIQNRMRTRSSRKQQPALCETSWGGTKCSKVDPEEVKSSTECQALVLGEDGINSPSVRDESKTPRRKSVSSSFSESSPPPLPMTRRSRAIAAKIDFDSKVSDTKTAAAQVFSHARRKHCQKRPEETDHRNSKQRCTRSQVRSQEFQSVQDPSDDYDRSAASVGVDATIPPGNATAHELRLLRYSLRSCSNFQGD